MVSSATKWRIPVVQHGTDNMEQMPQMQFQRVKQKQIQSRDLDTLKQAVVRIVNEQAELGTSRFDQAGNGDADGS